MPTAAIMIPGLWLYHSLAIQHSSAAENWDDMAHFTRDNRWEFENAETTI